jgi:hypothetical protein
MLPTFLDCEGIAFERRINGNVVIDGLVSSVADRDVYPGSRILIFFHP